MQQLLISLYLAAACPPSHGPPPEAFEACADLAEGDPCTVTLPDLTIEGTCRTPPHEEDASELVCVPRRPPRRGQKEES